MSRHQKLLRRFLAKARDFTYDELVTLLGGFGYHELKGGKTSGSRVAFYNETTRHIIRLHRPHPANVFRFYQMNEIENELKRKGHLP